MPRKLTAEQIAQSEARKARFRELANKIDAMTDDQRAELASRIPSVFNVEGVRYSANNTCLLSFQRENVTLVGGFQQWLKAGRCVRKGEKGLMIWVKVGKDNDATSAPTSTEQSDTSIRFIMGTVFDVTQTELVQVEQQAAA